MVLTTFLRHFLIAQRRPGIRKSHHNADGSFRKRYHSHSLVGQTRIGRYVRRNYSCTLRRSAPSIVATKVRWRNVTSNRKSHLLVTLILGILIWLVRLLLLLLLLLLSSLRWRSWDWHLRVHLLHFRQIWIHEVAEKDLRMKWSTRVGQLDMRHTVYSSLFHNRKPRPWVILVRY